VIRRENGFSWRGVSIEPYKQTTGQWKGITRRELSGRRGESHPFHVRYFEIAPGGFSSLEQHAHEHVVIPLRGHGQARFGCYLFDVGPGDVIYIAPHDPHQFLNPDSNPEPFGFLCIVDADRDPPSPVGDAGPCWICQ